MICAKTGCVFTTLAFLTAITAMARVPPVGAIPAGLRVPGSLQPTMALHASGVQIYACQPSKDDASQFAWTFTAPEANLTDGEGMERAHHYAGPTWEAADGSRVVGEVMAKDDGPDGHAIPWLLLKARETRGTGRFGHIGFIQRLHTVGGRAPTAGCTAAVPGKEVRIPYSADYYFYAAAP